MNSPVVPSISEVRALLAPLTLKQIDELAALSGVPATTIYKIKLADTENPGIETVRKFLPHVAAVLKGASVSPAPVEPAVQGS
jgi:predicted transcriptional regulator